jgi:uncharacterized short protein YbdD (DUF466 family)
MNYLRRCWQLLRELTGDAAYEHYLREHTCSTHAPLSRREFYIQRQNRKWSGIQRCC